MRVIHTIFIFDIIVTVMFIIVDNSLGRLRFTTLQPQDRDEKRLEYRYLWSSLSGVILIFCGHNITDDLVMIVVVTGI